MRAIRAPVLILVATTAFLLAGCGTGSDAASSSDSDGPDLSSAELETALLTTDDLGPGDWALDAADDDTYGDTGSDDTSDTFGSDAFEASADCQELLRQFDEQRAGADPGAPTAKVVYEKGDNQGQVQHEITRSENARDQLKAVRQAVSRCPTLRFERKGVAGRYEFDAFDVPALGDESVGFKLTTVVDDDDRFDFTLESYAAVQRRGDIVDTVFLTSGLDDNFSAVPVEPDDLAPLAEKADQRLSDVLAGAT